MTGAERSRSLSPSSALIPVSVSASAYTYEAPVNGQAYAISDRGRIVGMRNEVRRVVAATRFPGQPFELLPVPASPPYSYAWAVDRCGTIVGEITDGHNTRAVRWRKATCD